MPDPGALPGTLLSVHSPQEGLCFISAPVWSSSLSVAIWKTPNSRSASSVRRHRI